MTASTVVCDGGPNERKSHSLALHFMIEGQVRGTVTGMSSRVIHANLQHLIWLTTSYSKRASKLNHLLGTLQAQMPQPMQ
jgi:hypothetical protein